MSWKSTLHDYVLDKNQTSVECTAIQLPLFIADDAYLEREQIRRLGLQAIAKERQIRPTNGETKLRIHQVQSIKDGIIADIGLYQTRQYSLSRTEYTEERMEHERLSFRYFEGRWRITGVEHLRAEQSSKLNIGGERTSSPSLPFFNYSILKKANDAGLRRLLYNRLQVVEYANRWWNSANPAFLTFEVDCTNFASQCIFAGNAPMIYTGKRDLGWWYVGMEHQQELWSFSWAVAHALQNYAINSSSGFHGTLVESPQQLELGDMISYDWDGDGRFTHSAIVTYKDDYGMPLVNAHTNNSKHRYWSYRDSYAWTESTRYAFVHINNEMAIP